MSNLMQAGRPIPDHGSTDAPETIKVAPNESVANDNYNWAPTTTITEHSPGFSLPSGPPRPWPPLRRSEGASEASPRRPEERRPGPARHPSPSPDSFPNKLLRPLGR
jgi:hypothetical protein